MKDAFDVLMITHSSLCKGYEGALKLIMVVWQRRMVLRHMVKLSS